MMEIEAHAIDYDHGVAAMAKWADGITEGAGIIQSFPARIIELDRIGNGLRVVMAGGKESRLMWNDKRGRFVVPRRWRKPRFV